MDPVTIAALTATGVGAAGNLFNRPKAYSREDLNPDQGGLLMDAYRQHRNPTSSLPFYQRILADRSGFQKDALLSAASATGGSQAAATRQAESLGRSSRDQALQAAQGTYMQSQGLAMDALRQQMQNQQFAIQGSVQSQQGRRAHTAQLFDQIAGAGAGLLGDRYGAQQGAAQNQQSPAFSSNFNPSQFKPYAPQFGSQQSPRSSARTGLLNY